ncbi:unnamed protein product [Gemmataceae bacterium]|nr:unnamed protein product [Gemmataceae bacterium]VTT97712.1 unnamed protein product [Gemmataceae bacterium]
MITYRATFWLGLLVLFASGVMGFVLRGAPPAQPDAPRKPEPPDEKADPTAPHRVTLSFITDRDRYDTDDTALVFATFKGPHYAKIQFCTAGGSGFYFYLFVETLGRKRDVGCAPVWKLQLMRMPERPGWEFTHWLQALPTTYHQLSIHVPRLGCGPGEYRVRLGYARQRAQELQELAEKVYGETIAVDGMGTQRLEGSWDGAILSEPRVITIGPYVAPAPRPKP